MFIGDVKQKQGRWKELCQYCSEGNLKAAAVALSVNACDGIVAEECGEFVLPVRCSHIGSLTDKSLLMVY